MTSQRFGAKVHYQPGVVTIDLWGDLNAGAEHPLKAAYAEAESQNPQVIRLNFGQVEYINSTGIGLLIGLLAQARQTGQRLIAYGLPPQYMEIFALTRLTEYIGTFPDEASALTDVSLLLETPLEK